MQFASQYPTMVSAPPGLPKPPPRFCILWPGGMWTPLIPLDEVPGWLEFGNWGPGFSLGQYPVSMTYIPRNKEYEFVCRNCSHSVDSLDQSMPEREASVAGNAKPCPAPPGSPPPEQSSHASLPELIASIAIGYPFSMLGHPPFNAVLQAPFVGMCLVDMQTMQSNSTGSKSAGDSSSPGRQMSMENASPPHVFGPERMDAQPVAADLAGAARDLGTFGAGSPGLSLSPSENIHRWNTSHAHGVESPEKPQRVSSLRSESVASTRSLTAAVAILRMNRIQARRLTRGSSLCATISVTSTASCRSIVSISKVSKDSKGPSISVLSKHRRKVQLRRRRAQLNKTSKSPRSTLSLLMPKPKPEQPNSATKRRDRRERMKRGRKQSDRGKQPYYNKMRNPNWKPGMSKH
jgi:hypothetical protein